jgi:hypothetical protein
VTSPYRNESAALRERKESLEKEIAKIESQAAELEALRTQKQDLEKELSSVAKQLGETTKRSLPLLNDVKVASPCNAAWDEMLGNDQVRFCLSCEKNVYNLSAMTSNEAETLLQQRAKSELCIRFYQRTDGTILTADCPVGVKKKRRKKVALAVAGAGAMAFAATTAYLRGATCRQGEMNVPVQGQMVAPIPNPPETATAPAPPTGGHEIKGEYEPPVPTTTTTTPPTPPRPKGTGTTSQVQPPIKDDFVMGRK